MNSLDNIPWQDLTHAYGSAADVPDLLRALRTASPELDGEESPLWHLFGNIWHQGTVYEATSYAVPFLIELAVDRQTPDRVGILSLIAEIARGSSFRELHGDLLEKSDSEQQRNQELWARQANEAVAKGIPQFVDLTREPGDIACAAAFVLALLPECGAETAVALCRLLRDEERVPHRAALLLMMGSTGDVSQETISMLHNALTADEAVLRHAAAYAIVHLKVQPLPEEARKAAMDAIATEALEENLQYLPWGAISELDPNELYAALDEAERDQVIDGLIASLESGDATTHQVAVLVNLLFPPATRGPTPTVMSKGMSPQQFRAVCALYNAMKAGKRVFYGHFPCWGLPDTMREWRELASSHEPAPVGKTLPLLANAVAPQRPIAPGELEVGQKVIHRHFGKGTVTKVDVGSERTELTIRFENEGTKNLLLPTKFSAS